MNYNIEIGRNSKGCALNLDTRALNKHGVITGATGSGKTSTIKTLAEQLSINNITPIMIDLKGDLSGLSLPRTKAPKEDNREPMGFNIDYMNTFSISVSDLGASNLARILDLTDAQASFLGIAMIYAQDHTIELNTLKDLRLLILGMIEDSDQIAKTYGYFTRSTASTIIRKIIFIEGSEYNQYFNKTTLSINNIIERKKFTVINMKNLAQDAFIYSAFITFLLNDAFLSLEEVGDMNKPKAMLFIDEAHALFKTSNKKDTLKIESIIKLIRSKGLGVVFISQVPQDIPKGVLSQLGFKIQHALRIYTYQDRHNITNIAKSFDFDNYEEVAQGITNLKIGEVYASSLRADGSPSKSDKYMINMPLSYDGINKELEKDEDVADLEDRNQIRSDNEVVEEEAHKENRLMRITRQFLNGMLKGLE